MPRMTLEQFLAHLRGIKFVKRSDGIIRTPDYRECPVCAVANKVLGEKKYRLTHLTAAHAIGLSQTDASLVAMSADYKTWEHDESHRSIRSTLEGLCS